MATIQSPNPGPSGGPWRLLVLDTSDPTDPRWILCAVTLPEDVRPAQMEPDGRRYADWAETTAWVRERLGREQVSLVPVAAMAWRVDEGRPR